MEEANIAADNAFLIDRLLQAGAIVFGKTNVPYMLADAQSYNDIYGTTNNPWDPTRSPGGSSGGEAATLAAGLSALGAGSDIAGSLRNPAHYSGIYGHKPTWGLISTRGHAPPGIMTPTDISVVGPMARHAEDLGSGAARPCRTRPAAADGLAGRVAAAAQPPAWPSFASRCGHRLRYARSTLVYPTFLIAPSTPSCALGRRSTMPRDPG